MGPVIAGQNTAVLESIHHRYDRASQLCCLSSRCLIKMCEVTEHFSSSACLASFGEEPLKSNLSEPQNYRRWKDSKKNPPAQRSNSVKEFLFRANISALLSLLAFLSQDGHIFFVPTPLQLPCQKGEPEQKIWTKTIHTLCSPVFAWVSGVRSSCGNSCVPQKHPKSADFSETSSGEVW